MQHGNVRMILPALGAFGKEARIIRATDALLADQKSDGQWVYEFETDATYPAEYILLVRYLGEPPDVELERKIGRYLRRTQLPDGGWAFFTDGPMEISPSVCAYFALKIIGDSPDDTHMVQARKAILAAGGAEGSNVFTRIRLALHGIIPWDAIPLIPVEIMFLPSWFPFHLTKVSFWARTNIVPLAVLCTMRAAAHKPHGVRIDEVFHCPPETVTMLPPAPHQSAAWFYFFRGADTVLRLMEPFFPTGLRQRAIDKAVAWVKDRLHPEEGFASMLTMNVNALMMFDALGYPATYPSRLIVRRFIDSLIVIRKHEDEAYCCVTMSPMWETVVASHALMETGDTHALVAARRGLEWLRPRQILDVRGDWALRRPNMLPGGWPFQYSNCYYPDIDDTAVIVMALHRADPDAFSESIKRGRDWVVGMQSTNGGWGCYDADNTCYLLNHIPFSDHGSMLDPPTADITARCLSMLAQLDELSGDSPQRGLEYLLRDQEPNGSWYGNWHVNYIYGTWSALSALNVMGMSHDDAPVKRSMDWLLTVQNEDGGWGEDARSYKLDYSGHEWAPSTPTQTAWALLGLMAAGAVHHPAVARGVKWLRKTQCEHGAWEEKYYVGACFPRLLYIRYHGYCKYFPLWALARYRNLKRGGLTRVRLGL